MVYDSADNGVTYDKVSVDSSLYDNKDRIVLERSRDAIDKKNILGYTSYKYKTNFNTADTIRVFSLNDAGDKLVLSNETNNVLDAKGNVLTEVIKKPDAFTNIFGPDTKKTTIYNAKNLPIETLEESWQSGNTTPDWGKIIIKHFQIQC